MTGTSSVRVSGIAGNAPADLRLSVATSYAWPSELKLALIAPDGTSYTVHNGASTMPGTFVVDASAEVANGVWRLWVQRNSSCCTVTITSWSLWSPVNRQATPPGPTTKFANGNDAAITDDGYYVESGVQVSGIPGNAPADLRVTVDIKHPNRGDLKLDLVAPDGTVYPLEDLTGSGNGDDVVTEYSVNASAEPANGVWRLRVADSVLGAVGLVDSWSLTFPAPSKYHNPDNVTISDNGSAATSVIAVAGRTGAAPADLRVVADVRHGRPGHDAVSWSPVAVRRVSRS